MPRIDQAMRKIRAQKPEPPEAVVEWVRENGEHVVMEAHGCAIHTTIDGKKQKVHRAVDHAMAVKVINELCHKDTIR